MVGGIGGAVGLLLLVSTIATCAMILLRRKRAERWPLDPRLPTFVPLATPPRVDLPKPMRLPGKTDMAADMLLDEA